MSMLRAVSRPDDQFKPWLLGENLRMARASYGLSISQLAELAKIAPGQLRKIEAGAATPRVDTLFRIEQSLGFRPGELLKQPENEERAEPSKALEPVGYLLKESRLARGLTQNELAQRIRVSRSQITRWESGKTLPSLPATLAAELGLDLEPGTLSRSLEATLRKALEPDHETSGNWPSLPNNSVHLPAPGLLGPDGKVLAHSDPKASRLLADARKFSLATLREFARQPELLRSLHPRDFQELIGELMARDGYDVTLTPKGPDGGIDLFALRKDSVGAFLYVVQCKRHSAHRPVRVGVVRELYGVLSEFRAAAGMIATTSFFTSEAIKWQQRVPFRLSLKNYADLRTWLSRAR